MTLSGTDSEAPPTYPARDFLCLDCVVPGECDPYSVLCLWRADRREPDEREVRTSRGFTIHEGLACMRASGPCLPWQTPRRHT